MRHISLSSQMPDAAWLSQAAAVLAKLQAAASTAARNDVIDANKSLWVQLKPWLLSLSNNKCWFSEAKDCFNHWHVEHFRPKKAPEKGQNPAIHHSYWWLAFDWRNYRICGSVGNTTKGSYFPLRPGCPRCNPLGDLRYELPALLDPTDEHDPTLLSFTLEGRAVAAAHVKDPWELERVAISVVRYQLDFPQLMDKRKSIWADCWARAQAYLDELARFQADPANMVAKEACKQAAREVRDLIRGDQELSAVSRACLFSSGDPRLQALLVSA